jgi:hypothetical protein
VADQLTDTPASQAKDDLTAREAAEADPPSQPSLGSVRTRDRRGLPEGVTRLG